MPRIRTIKPEFWDSPSTAKAGPWARLLYIAMWNWADDHGRGTANLKELEGFAFPNDDAFTVRSGGCSGNTVTCDGTSAHFRDVVAEVAECFDVVFYEVDGRPYYEIRGWDKHQRNERRAKESRYPEPPSQTGSSGNTVHLRRSAAETPHTSEPGTGEQGNRGTGEQGNSEDDSSGVVSPIRDDVAAILDHLDQRIAANGARIPTRSKANVDAARLLLDADGQPSAEVHDVIDWATRDDFWAPNILSAKKLRAKFDQLKMQRQRKNGRRQSQTDDLFAESARRMGVRYDPENPFSDPQRQDIIEGEIA